MVCWHSIKRCNSLVTFISASQHHHQQTMCDLYGDIETKGLLLDTNAIVSRVGQVCSELKAEHSEVKGIYECVGRSVKEVLPFIGHERDTIGKYVHNENYIPYKPELREEFNLLKARSPGAYLVKKEDKLFGVLIDELNQATILGTVSMVVPYVDNEVKQNVVLIKQNGQVEMTSTKHINMDRLVIETNAKLGVVSLDGFLLVQSDPNSNELILILQHGYFILQDGDIDWTRRSIDPVSKDEDSQKLVPCRQTKLQSNEIFVTNMGAIVMTGASQMKLFGSHNAIVNYNAFKQCISSLDSGRRQCANEET